MLSFFIVLPAHPLPLEYTHYIILQILCQFSKTLYSSYDSFAYTATDGKKYNVDYYNLDVIISVGYRVKSHRGTQSRIWAIGIIKEYMKKGFALDDDRLKRLGGGNYFAELLARIRDIRSSEKVFWRKVLEIYATSIDYNSHAESSVLQTGSKPKEPMYMKDWLETIDDYLKMTRRDILTSSGRISHKQAIEKAHAEYYKYKNRLDDTLSPVEKDFIESIGMLKQISDSSKK